MTAGNRTAPPRWPDRQIRAVARTQRTLITRAQLLALDLTTAAIDYSVARGRLIVVHRGVYTIGDGSLPPFGAELAGVLATGRDAHLSHGSAAFLHGMQDRGPSPVQLIVVGRDAGRRRPGLCVHRCRDLLAAERCRRNGIPATSPARTLLDIAPERSERQLERAFDDGLKRRLFTRDAVARVAAARPHHPGASPLAALAASELRVSTITRSGTEERLLALVRAAGLPTPDVNAPLGPYVVDFLWRAQRLVLEVDGHAFHSTRRSFEGDRARDLELRDAGWEVIRCTHDQLLRRPERVLAAIVRALDRGELSRRGAGEA